MLYRLLIIFFCLSFLQGQSLFNRWIGTDPFTGSARSTAMGNTHLLNSSGSSNVRFNPANLTFLNSQLGFDIQIDRLSMFERWSIPTKDGFGNFLTYSDYVANEYSYYGLRGGLFVNTNVLGLGRVGLGFHYAPLAHFTYNYLEEVRGTYEDYVDGEYASRDPIVGYQNLSTDGLFMVASLGGGLQLNAPGDIELSLGVALNLIQSSKISDRVGVDTLFSDVTYLSTYPDVQQDDALSEANYLSISTKWKLNSNLIIAASWEDSARATTNDFSWTINSANGLFQYWEDGTYVVSGANYIKPEIISFALSIISEFEQKMSIDFEVNQILYHNHLNLKNYSIYKFGFEYLTQMGTSIRGGLVYKTPAIHAMKPISIFTFGIGKNIGNLVVDVAGTYCLHSFNYPDLFPVDGEIRPDYDLVRESQLQLQLALTYQF